MATRDKKQATVRCCRHASQFTNPTCYPEGGERNAAVPCKVLLLKEKSSQSSIVPFHRAVCLVTPSRIGSSSQTVSLVVELSAQDVGPGPSSPTMLAPFVRCRQCRKFRASDIEALPSTQGSAPNCDVFLVKLSDAVNEFGVLHLELASRTRRDPHCFAWGAVAYLTKQPPATTVPQCLVPPATGPVLPLLFFGGGSAPGSTVTSCRSSPRKKSLSPYADEYNAADGFECAVPADVSEAPEDAERRTPTATEEATDSACVPRAQSKGDDTSIDDAVVSSASSGGPSKFPEPSEDKVTQCPPTPMRNSSCRIRLPSMLAAGCAVILGVAAAVLLRSALTGAKGSRNVLV